MTLRESDFNRVLREKLAENNFRIYRIESHTTEAGISDDHFIHKPTGNSGWLEIKQELKMPKKIRYRPKQALWLVEYSEAHGNCATILHIKTINVAIFIPGIYSLEAENNLTGLCSGKTKADNVMLISLSEPIGWIKLSKAILNLNYI